MCSIFNSKLLNYQRVICAWWSAPGDFIWVYPKGARGCCRKCFLLQGTLVFAQNCIEGLENLGALFELAPGASQGCHASHRLSEDGPGQGFPQDDSKWLRCRSGAPRNRPHLIHHWTVHWSSNCQCLDLEPWSCMRKRSSQFHPKHHVSGSACRAFQELGIRGVSKWQQQDGRGFSETNGEHHDLWSRLQYIGWCVERHVFPSSDACT